MRQAPERWSVEARPEVSRPEPPQRSPWPVIVGGLIATVGSIVVLGAIYFVLSRPARRIPVAVVPDRSDAAQAPWIRAEYTDAEGRPWKELDLPTLVQQPEFLDVGI